MVPRFDNDRGLGSLGIDKSCCFACFSILFDKFIQGPRVERPHGTGLHADGFLVRGYPVKTEGAHLHFCPRLFAELGNAVRAGLFAKHIADDVAEAEIPVYHYYPVFAPFADGLCRTCLRTGGTCAVTAGKGEVGEEYIGIRAPFL